MGLQCAVQEMFVRWHTNTFPASAFALSDFTESIPSRLFLVVVLLIGVFFVLWVCVGVFLCVCVVWFWF